MWSILDTNDGLQFSLASKTGTKRKHLYLDNSFETRSVPDTLISALKRAETKNTKTQTSAPTIPSTKEFPSPNPDDNGSLSTALNPACQHSSSPPIPADANPIIPSPPSPSADRNKKTPIYTLDFEKELVAALRLNTGPRAEEFKLSEFPDKGSVVSSGPVARSDGGRGIFESEDENERRNRKGLVVWECEADASDADKEDQEDTRNDGRDVRDALSVSFTAAVNEPLVKAPSDNASDEQCRLPISPSDKDLPQASKSAGEKDQFHENQPEDEYCSSSRLSYASNVTLVLASKAVGADQVRELINGLPVVGPENGSFIRGCETMMQELDFDARESDSGGSPSDALAALESNHNMESAAGTAIGSSGEYQAGNGDAEDAVGSLPVSSPSDGINSGNLSDHPYIPSVSPLGTPEASQRPLQRPPFSYGFGRFLVPLTVEWFTLTTSAQANNSNVSLPSEHRGINQRDNIYRVENTVSCNSRHPSGGISSLPSQSSPLRNETSLSNGTKNRIFGSLSHRSDSYRSMGSLRVNSATSGNNLAIFTAQVPDDHHQPPKGHSAMDKLRNIGKFHRASGAGPTGRLHKKALSRLSVCPY